MIMSTLIELPHIIRTNHAQMSHDSASSITWNASKQTYYTIRLLVDRNRVQDAYRAYGYCRWLDDQLDQGGLDLPARAALGKREQTLIDWVYTGEWPQHLGEEEELLVNLIRSDTEP